MCIRTYRIKSEKVIITTYSWLQLFLVRGGGVSSKFGSSIVKAFPVASPILNKLTIHYFQKTVFWSIIQEFTGTTKVKKICTMFRLFILCNLYETLLETANNIRLRGSKHWDQWLETILVRCVFPFLIFCSSNQMAEEEAVRADEFGTIKQEVYIYIYY